MDPILPLAESFFLPADPSPDPSMPEPDWVDALDGDYLYAHVASPDVYIDEANQRLVMYYHGLLPGWDQQTRLAMASTSSLGNPCWDHRISGQRSWKE